MEGSSVDDMDKFLEDIIAEFGSGSTEEDIEIRQMMEQRNTPRQRNSGHYSAKSTTYLTPRQKS